MSCIPVRRVALVAHCLLNPGTRAWESPTRYAKIYDKAGSELLAVLARHQVGAIQLPCPEFLKYGNPRKLRGMKEYKALPGFTDYCAELAGEVAAGLAETVMLADQPRLTPVMVLGVEHSPTCAIGTGLVHKKTGTPPDADDGLFMRELRSALDAHGLEIPFLGISFRPERFQKSLIALRELCERLS